MSPGTVLLAGAAGFIGSHLTRRLLADGHRVLAVDDLSTGRRANLQVERHRERLSFRRHDVCEPMSLDEPVDWVLNLASPASPKAYLERPVATLRTGSLATHRLLDIALRNDAGFLLASTSEVYGDPEVSPQAEDYWGHVNPVGPRSVYDEAKRYAEALTTAYHRDRGLETRIVRIFNTYGPRMDRSDGRVIPNFLTQALTGRSLTVYGDGSQTRSFCYVDDLVEGLVRAMERGDPDPINLGNDREITILALAEIVQGMTPEPVDIEHRPLPKDDPQQRRPDLTRARKRLGYQPTVTLEAGLKRTMDAFAAEVQEVSAR